MTNSMEQSPSWEANRSSASQEIHRILWKPKVHYRIHNSPPPVLSWAISIQSMPPHPTCPKSHIPFSLLRLYQRIIPGPRLCDVFRKMVIFYGEVLLAPLPTPKLEGHPLSAVRDCLFNVFAATLHIRRPFLHPQPEDAPFRGDRDGLIVVTGTDLSWWQGPTYRGDRDPLIMATNARRSEIGSGNCEDVLKGSILSHSRNRSTNQDCSVNKITAYKLGKPN
jgi:hypothetical protein